MKKPNFLCLIPLIFVILFVSEAKAVSYGYSLIDIDQETIGSPLEVYVESGTVLDYNVWLYYEPGIQAFLYENGNLLASTNREMNPTGSYIVALDEFEAGYGKTYTLHGDHYLGALILVMSGGQPYFVDYYGFNYFSGNFPSPYSFAPGATGYYLYRIYKAATTNVSDSSNRPLYLNSIDTSGALPGQNIVTTLRGTGLFGNNQSVQISGNGVNVAIRPGQGANTIEVLDIEIQIDQNAPVGSREIRLSVNGQTSNPVTFRVGDNSPVIGHISPPQGNTGDNVGVTITGSHFGSNPMIQIDGAGINPTITSASANEITAVFSISSTTYIGMRSVKVVSRGVNGTGFTPATNNSDTSNGMPFDVTNQTYSALIDTVGFDGGFPIKKFESLGYPLIANPTWSRGGSNNAKNYAAFKKGTETSKMKLSATLKVSPQPTGGNLNARTRVKLGSNVIAEQSASSTVNGDTVTVSNLSLTGNLESTPTVKKGVYNFDWEVSFDNGNSWISAGTSQHPIYWTYDDVIEVPGCDAPANNPSIARGCLFVNNWGRQGYAGLFDKALEKAVDELSQNDQTPDQIAKKLAWNIDDQINYNPGNSDPDELHPLASYSAATGVQCAVNANLLRGLLRSIGINNSETVYVWGGKPNRTDLKETGGMTFGYRRDRILQQPAPGQNPVSSFYYSFQAIRPASNEGSIRLEKDPHFTFHAMVKIQNDLQNDSDLAGARFYDPSYAKRLEANPGRYGDYPYINNNLKFKMAADLSHPTDTKKHKWVKDIETMPFVVRSFFNELCLPNLDSNGVPVDCPSNTTKIFRKSAPPNWIAGLPNISVFDDQMASTFTVWRPSDGVWYTRNSYNDTNTYFQFGLSGDIPASADFDGDGNTDYAIYRPSNTTFYIWESEANSLRMFQWNSSTDRPVYGDFDGDGKADIAFYREGSPSKWFIVSSADGEVTLFDFGIPGDIPVYGDFDGDGKSDIAVYRQSTGTWWWWKTSDWTWANHSFGSSGDIPVTGKYDSDGKTDLAFYRPSNNRWYIRYSTNNREIEEAIGLSGDVPVPGDYDGDGITDLAVWSPSNGRWYAVGSYDNAIYEEYWGLSTDIPISSRYIP